MWNVCLINLTWMILFIWPIPSLSSFIISFLWQSFDTCDSDLAGKRLRGVWQPAPPAVKKSRPKKLPDNISSVENFVKHWLHCVGQHCTSSSSSLLICTSLKLFYRRMSPDSTCDKWHLCLMWCFHFKEMVGWSSEKRKSLVLQKMASCLETDCSIFDGEIKKSPWEKIRQQDNYWM